ncbi:hypothetical protein [Lentzea sp. NBRC 102530]|uniref:hypothetical protein n=1 Tax=Lentzea sp. NBRC 102530 TaxID=3032201 RepID=UPI0024A563FA|nr:hypothetical protein [Lentzea sp. NBRC 102530]GLY55211.1 hypothetical protein Lesp01_88660 [Lentzea sp. NBRC 102530]
MVTLTVPAPSRELTSNLFGLVGVVGLVLAVGGLTGSWWWSLAVASLVCVGLSWLGHVKAQAAAKREAESPAAAAPAPAAASTAQAG